MHRASICKMVRAKAKVFNQSNDLIRVQTIMVMSQSAYDALPDDLKETINEVAWEQVAWANQMAEASEEETLSHLSELGV